MNNIDDICNEITLRLSVHSSLMVSGWATLETSVTSLLNNNQNDIINLKSLQSEQEASAGFLAQKVDGLLSGNASDTTATVLSNSFDAKAHQNLLKRLRDATDAVNEEADRLENEYFALQEQISALKQRLMEKRCQLKKEEEERKKREEEKRKKREEEERMKREEEERKKKQEEEERQEKEEEERKKKKEEERKRKEGERKRKEEERNKKEEERKRKEEEKRMKKEEEGRKKKEEEERKKREEEERKKRDHPKIEKGKRSSQQSEGPLLIKKLREEFFSPKNLNKTMDTDYDDSFWSDSDE